MLIIKIIREPLLHFMLAGFLLFILYNQVAPGSADANHVVVTKEQVNFLKMKYEQEWLRPPTAGETQTLIDEYILDEIYYREALALGIDAGDEVIRRRLRQKLSFFVEDTLRLANPDEQELQDFYQAHQQEFATAPQFSFDQLFISTDSLTDTAIDKKLSVLKEKLAHGEAVSGDPSLLQRSYTLKIPSYVDGIFGEGFSWQLQALPVGQWQSLRSSLGVHLVRLTEYKPAAVRPFAELRSQVVQRWQSSQRLEMTNQYNAQLLKKYQISRPEAEARDG
ncbi:peptidyl-prolyl cis-trans isomerase [Halioxenophilus sp. WMMB6]|uniref:peptidyl-prolyl cis-trans isomerase n=1 Tax=Halioxenophilus sp. WMMB6 TaxID=3073815 RepID=UPI00295ED441|nr:peptidyl-prolyl cis-trans isomerase [Halioxenophilus sp. WMMB6]